MESYDLQRHQLIKTLTTKNNGKTVDTVILLWEQMATKTISIVGENGFRSLYIRSILLNKSKFPCLSKYDPKSEINNQFTELKLCLEKQHSNQIIEVNNQLLITLSDILSSLIGETLTTKILCLAWGDVTPDFVSKELNNE